MSTNDGYKLEGVFDGSLQFIRGQILTPSGDILFDGSTQQRNSSGTEFRNPRILRYDLGTLNYPSRNSLVDTQFDGTVGLDTGYTVDDIIKARGIISGIYVQDGIVKYRFANHVFTSSQRDYEVAKAEAEHQRWRSINESFAQQVQAQKDQQDAADRQALAQANQQAEANQRAEQAGQAERAKIDQAEINSALAALQTSVQNQRAGHGASTAQRIEPVATQATPEPNRSKIIASNGRSANDCVKLVQLAAHDSKLGGGNSVIANNCGEEVEIAWCYVDTECSRGSGNQWNLGAGRSWPVSSGREIRYSACYGPDTIHAVDGSAGTRYYCTAPAR